MEKIDLEKIIAKKNPRLLKVLPRFLLRYLKRIIHQDDVNDILELYGNKKGVDFINGSFSYLDIHFSTSGLENVPQTGHYIFIANHPLGGIDGTILLKTVIENFGSAKFIVNDILMNLPPLADLFVGINKYGKQSLETYRKVEALYASDLHVCYFPAGLCSRKIKGEIRDLEWKKSIIGKARQYERNIVPVYFDARNSNWFYNLSNFRKKTGIKANIEMLYLIDEVYKQKGCNIQLYFGKPIPYTTFTKEHKDNIWANKLREHVYLLKEDTSRDFLN